MKKATSKSEVILKSDYKKCSRGTSESAVTAFEERISGEKVAVKSAVISEK